MVKNIDLLLRRAADFQKMTDPEDDLSRMVRAVTEECELSLDQLNYVAAARQDISAPQDNNSRGKGNSSGRKWH